MDRERNPAFAAVARVRSGLRSRAAALNASRLKRVGVVTYFSVYAGIALGGWIGVLDLLRWLPLLHARGLGPLHVMFGLPRSVAWGLVSLSVAISAVGVVAAHSLYGASTEPPALGDASTTGPTSTVRRAIDRLRARVGSWGHRVRTRGADSRATTRELDGGTVQGDPDGEFAGGDDDPKTPEGRATATNDGDGVDDVDGDGTAANDRGDDAPLTGDGGRDDVDLSLVAPPVQRLDAPLTLAPESEVREDAEIIDGHDPTEAADSPAVHTTASPAEDAAWPEESAAADESEEMAEDAPDEAAPWPGEADETSSTEDAETDEEASTDERSFDEDAPWPDDWITGDSL